jgi:hypothetical protein
MDAKLAPPAHDTEPDLSETEIADFIARNSDALNASIEAAHAELSAGLISTLSMDEIIARGRASSQD